MIQRVGDPRAAGGVAAAGAATRRPRAGEGGFRLPGAAGEAGGAGAAAGVSALSLLAIQEERGDDAGRDERGARRGAAMLRELAAMQAELLRGRRDPARLTRLAALAEGEAPADPGLAEALAGVALRARIELARAGMRAGMDTPAGA